MKNNIITEKNLRDLGDVYYYYTDSKEFLRTNDDGNLEVLISKKVNSLLLAKKAIREGLDDEQFVVKYLGYVDENDEVYYEAVTNSKPEEVEEVEELVEEEPVPEDEILDEEWLDAKLRFEQGINATQILVDNGVKLNSNKFNAWKRTAKDIDGTDPEKLKKQFEEIVQFGKDNAEVIQELKEKANGKKEEKPEKKSGKKKKLDKVKEGTKETLTKKTSKKKVENEVKIKTKKKAIMFPKTIEVEGEGTLTLASGKYLKFDDVRKAVEAGKEIFLANYLTKEDFEEYKLNERYGIEPPVKSLPLNLDITYPLVACSKMDKLHTISLYTEAVYFYWGDSFEEIKAENGEKYRESYNMEYQVYEK